MESGSRSSATVVTAATLIMIMVFAGFVGSHDPTIKSIGFGLAVAVAFGAFGVRMTIVPAVLVLLGDWAWWLPRRLVTRHRHRGREADRVVPPPERTMTRSRSESAQR
ncbi:MMPL family transporter [Streptomyces sp. NPDC048565]|uniref:MMPL family transporter n=1 Tax=Streptomyces sp. NPDC048565 TaxID=3155266 RepID=UPI003427F09C